MFKYVLSIIFSLIVFQILSAQDEIIKTNGDIIECRVITVDSSKIEYKIFSANDTVINFISTDEVHSFTFNGNQYILNEILKTFEVNHSDTSISEKNNKIIEYPDETASDQYATNKKEKKKQPRKVSQRNWIYAGINKYMFYKINANGTNIGYSFGIRKDFIPIKNNYISIGFEYLALQSRLNRYRYKYVSIPIHYMINLNEDFSIDAGPSIEFHRSILTSIGFNLNCSMKLIKLNRSAIYMSPEANIHHLYYFSDQGLPGGFSKLNDTISGSIKLCYRF